MLPDLDLPSGLPDSLKSWKRIDVMRDPEWWKPWDLLRPSFKNAGYELYDARPYGQSSTCRSADPPAPDSFGLYGDRTNFKGTFLAFPNAFAARDRKNRDVVIKPISKGDEGRTEREILQLLNSEPLRSDPANPAIQVIEFIDLYGFCFAIMPCCDACDERSFVAASECLDFAEQVLQGLSFLHKHRIAHLDLSHENILINHRGTLPPLAIFGESPFEPPVMITPPLQWRSTFPVKYYFIDFGFSAVFSKNAALEECLVEPFPTQRQQRPPELHWDKAFNPFAADVYFAARLLYGLLSDITDKEPSLLKLLQDMSHYNPSRRITAASALTRLRELRLNIPDDEQERDLATFQLIPSGESAHTS